MKITPSPCAGISIDNEYLNILVRRINKYDKEVKRQHGR